MTIGFSQHAGAHAGHDVQLKRLDEAIAQQPRSQALYIERAALHTQAHRFTEAEADFTRAEALGAAVATTYHRALLHEARGDYTAARTALDEYIQQYPRSHYAFEARARVAQALGDNRAAVSDLRKNLALIAQPNPGNYIAAAKLLAGLGDTGAALTLLDEGLERLGVVPSLQREAIALEQSNRNVRGAIARLETLREPLHESAQWKLEMATLLSTAGERDMAAATIDGLTRDLEHRRPTPARLRLLQKAHTLRATLEEQSSDAAPP